MSSAPNSADPDPQQRLLARFGRRFEVGAVIFNDGEPATEAFLLQEGRVRLIKRVAATERSLRVLRPGELFGETALIPGATRNSTAVALSDGLLMVLDPGTFDSVLSSNAAIGGRVLQQLVRRLRDAEDQIEVLMMRDGQLKVVSTLLKLAQQALGGRTDGSVAIHVSPLELSTRVGLDVETVKRQVSKLRESGYLRIVDEKVEIADLEAVRELFRLLGLKEQIRGADAALPR